MVSYGEPGWATAAKRYQEVLGKPPPQTLTVAEMNSRINSRVHGSAATVYGEPGWYTAAQRFQEIFGRPPSQTDTAEKINAEVQRALKDPARWDPRYVAPDPDTNPPPPEPIDFRARAAALYPYLPSALLDLYADAWAETGDPTLALAEVRQSSQYGSFFPGIRREDGSLRMTEAEYLGRVEGYKMAYQQFNLNPSVFDAHITEMIEGGVSAQQLANRLSAAYSQILTAIPAAKQFYADNFGLALTDEAIFASFIDPDISDAVLNQRIAVSQIGGAGAASGFNVDLDFAEAARQRGLDQGGAQEFFGQAAYQIPVLDRLASRFDNDRDVSLDEFAAAGIFDDPVQRRRFERVLSAETSSFSDQFGNLRQDDEFRLRGLRQR